MARTYRVAHQTTQHTSLHLARTSFDVLDRVISAAAVLGPSGELIVRPIRIEVVPHGRRR